jgi:hypothetical protein
MLKYLTMLLMNGLIISQTNAFGQSIVRYSLSSLGSTFSKEGYIIRQTIGQPSNTFVVKNGSLILRQGFQQPLFSEHFPDKNIPIDFKLSPNPARGMTLVEFNEPISSYAITISNLNGIQLSRISRQSLLIKWLDLNGYAPGVYIITITGDKRIGSKKLIVSP